MIDWLVSVPIWQDFCNVILILNVKFARLKVAPLGQRCYSPVRKRGVLEVKYSEPRMGDTLRVCMSPALGLVILRTQYPALTHGAIALCPSRAAVYKGQIAV